MAFIKRLKTACKFFVSNGCFGLDHIGSYSLFLLYYPYVFNMSSASFEPTFCEVYFLLLPPFHVDCIVSLSLPPLSL